MYVKPRSHAGTIYFENFDRSVKKGIGIRFRTMKSRNSVQEAFNCYYFDIPRSFLFLSWHETPKSNLCHNCEILFL